MQRPAMGWTVGPLPSSVYWRRRALVVIAAALVVLLAWLALRGGGGGKPSAVASEPAKAGNGVTGTAAPTGTATAGSTPTPGSDASSPQIVPASPDASSAPAADRSPPPASVPPCADDQIAVTVTASPSPGVVGGTFTFYINISSRATDWCSRDLGPGAQEVQIMHDGALLFSSDDCDTGTSADVRAFAAGDAVRYRFQWSSFRATPHTCAKAAAPAPPGTYQVVARIGTKVSAPTDFTITR
ncbi:hypothetical protein [Dactylosporangium sp. CA-233914]|uniref:hypothetical protein n=1 Tax=Dactylosporangium sp. CA-233914 TaxID=3239934 RepID=UPI003D8FE9D6